MLKKNNNISRKENKTKKAVPFFSRVFETSRTAPFFVRLFKQKRPDKSAVDRPCTQKSGKLPVDIPYFKMRDKTGNSDTEQHKNRCPHRFKSPTTENHQPRDYAPPSLNPTSPDMIPTSSSKQIAFTVPDFLQAYPVPEIPLFARGFLTCKTSICTARSSRIASVTLLYRFSGRKSKHNEQITAPAAPPASIVSPKCQFTFPSFQWLKIPTAVVEIVVASDVKAAIPGICGR